MTTIGMRAAGRMWELRTQVAPRRRGKAVKLQAQDVGVDGTFAGYGSIFGNVDEGGDVVERGAFAVSLEAHRSKGRMPKLLWQHDPSEPNGVWLDMREDTRGLWCQGKLLLEVDRARQAHTLLRHGAIDGLSIGYDCKVWETGQAELEAAYMPAGPGLPRYGAAPTVRRLMEIDLWEVSLVTFPMNRDALVDTSTVKRDPWGPLGRPVASARYAPELAELARIVRGVNLSLSRPTAGAPKKGLLDWFVGLGGPPDDPAEREAWLLRQLDETGRQIVDAVARSDREALEQLEWELRDGSPYDYESVERRVDELLESIERGLAGIERVAGSEWR
jgi:HK97 family phage prohead protease